MTKTPTAKLYNLYAENKKKHSEQYVNELLLQVEMFATESSTLGRAHIQQKLERIIEESKTVDKQ